MASVGLRDIRKTFGKTTVLKGVDLDVADGEFVSLVGPSGCGKSTLLRIVAGLERQDFGEVRLGDVDIGGRRPAERDLAMVFQSYALYPHLTVFDNIAVPLRMRRLSNLQRLPLVGGLVPGARAIDRKIRGDVAATAEMLGLAALLDRRPGQLSGGQRQRVAVGRAIVREPHAFLLDEPLSNLDAKLRVHMRSEIAALHRRLGATFVYVTHDQAEAMTMSDRIAVMMDGHIVQVGTPDAVYSDPRDLRVAEFVGSPKINLLPAAVDEDGSVRMLGAPTPVRVAHPVGAALRVGLRPEALRVDREGPIVGRIVHLENLGSEVFVHLAVEGCGAPVVSRHDREEAGAMRLGECLRLGFAASAMRIFGADGLRVDVVRASIPREAAHV